MTMRPFGRTQRAQWLGEELRRMRTERDMSLQLVATHLQRDASALSRYERGEWPIGRADVVALLDLYGHHRVDERERWLRLAEEVWVTDYWTENYSDVLQPSFIDFPWLEARATRVCSYHAMLVPGLFQLREYAEAVIRNAERDSLTEAQIQLGVDLRMDRQRVLTEPDGPHIDIVVEEAALRRPVDGPTLARAQLEHVLACASLPRVTVRVLPASIGLHSGIDGEFWVFEIPAPYPAVAYLEYIGGQFYLESPKSDRYVRAYDGLRTEALDARESVAFIADLAKELA